MAMYTTAHRGMMAHNQIPNNHRLTELLESIKAEFENQAAGRSAADGHERDQFVAHQLQEHEQLRRRIHELEQAFIRTKDNYEKEIESLKRELDMRGGPSHPGHHPHGGPSQPAPPSIGHGPRDLFGQIMQGGQGQAPLGPPPEQPQQPQGLPAHLTQGAGLNTGPPPSHTGFGAYQPAPGPALNGYQPQPQPPPQLNSPGPNRSRGRGAPGAATPSQTHPAPYQAHGSPRSHVPTPPPGHRQPPLPPTSVHHAQVPHVGNHLWKLIENEEDLPKDLKKKGDDWAAFFNPALPRRLDITLMHTLSHTSVVCCVRFSQDGRYIATGCNRIAQIFDVNSGALVANLEDPNADKDGDLYIRSVCFSPDGRLLATGAEDRLIRVWDIEKREIKVQLAGHNQDIYSLDFSYNGRTIASGSGDKTVRLWDTEAGSESVKLEIEDGVTTVALSSDGRLVAAGSLDRSVRVWDTDEGRPVVVLHGHEDSVYSVAFAPNSMQLVSGSLDRTIKMWQLPDRISQGGGVGKGQCIRTFEGHADFVLSVALTPDGGYVLSGSKDRGVQFWDPRTGEALVHLQGHRNSVISVAPSPSGQLFATGSGDQKARIWKYHMPGQ